MSATRDSNSAVRGGAVEELAQQYLRRRGLSLLERNFRCRRGEVDLIMRDGDEVVFVEVRYRRSAAFGSAAESVNAAKQARIATAAQLFLLRHGRDTPCRFDVVAVSGADCAEISWIKDAFRLSA